MGIEFWSNFFTILLYALGVALLVSLIILVIKLISVINKTDNILEDVDNKVHSLDGLFSVIDKTTDGISRFSDVVIGGAIGSVTNFFVDRFQEKKRKEEMVKVKESV